MNASSISSKKTQYSTSRKTTKQRKLPLKEQVRLGQLLICLALFLTVFVGKGVFPERLEQMRSTLWSLLCVDIDFQAAFSELGRSVGTESGFIAPISRFYVEVFGPDDMEAPDLPAMPAPVINDFMVAEQAFLCSDPDYECTLTHYFHETGKEDWSIQLQADENVLENAPEVTAAAGTILLEVAYDGQPLPERYTLNMISLGELETVTPVMGTINSGFGYRDHPVNGKYRFHGGVDIGGQIGDPILAFAAGTVEYVGEDTSYGLYLQLDHGNGVKSFYAHCDSVCVKKGQTVGLGERIGAVGESGTATGPHLHLEIKYQQLHLDPAHYIESISSV